MSFTITFGEAVLIVLAIIIILMEANVI